MPAVLRGEGGPGRAGGGVADGFVAVPHTMREEALAPLEPHPPDRVQPGTLIDTAMYRQMEDDMDVNAGTILDGEETIEQVGWRFFDLVVRAASGERSKSEEPGMGDNEFVPWQIGAVP